MSNLTAADQWAYNGPASPGRQTQPGEKGYSISISGTWTGTLTVQRSKDGTNWFDLASYSGNVELDGEVSTPYYIRCGFKSGASVTGTAVVNVY